MKLEYFADAFGRKGLLLLHSGSPGEVAQLRDALHRLLVVGTSIALHDLEFVESVANCEVIASSDPRGRVKQIRRMRALASNTFTSTVAPKSSTRPLERVVATPPNLLMKLAPQARCERRS